MMRRRVVHTLFVLPALAGSVLAMAPRPVGAQTGSVAVTSLDGQQRYTADQLDNLTGPVALYPDALLAQVLVAATFPDQIEDAAQFVRANGTDNIDAQSWDVSVKAVAHYPSALNAMADKLDWTAALGKAYATQSSEVMQSVQRLRGMAAANGNLNTTTQQQVITHGTTYEIVPAEPRVIYVPVYDPYIIYSRPIFNLGFVSRYWSFGVGFPIGSWLSYDCDWGLQRVYYNGWSPAYYSYGGDWRARSRPYVRLTDIYVSPRYRTVYVNHAIVNRYVDYRNVERYSSVHRDTRFDGRHDNRDNGRDNRDGRAYGTDNSRNGNDSRNSGERGNGANGAATPGGYVNQARPRNDNPGSSRDGAASGNDNPNPSNANGGGGRSAPSGRLAVPQERRREPAARTDGQPQIVVPQGNNAPRQAERNDGETVRAPQQREPRALPQAPEPRQAQEQRQAPQAAPQAAPQRTEKAESRPAPARQAQPRTEKRADPPARGRGGDDRRGGNR